MARLLWMDVALTLWAHNHDLPEPQQLSISRQVVGLCRIAPRDPRVLSQILSTYDSFHHNLKAAGVEAVLTHERCDSALAAWVVGVACAQWLLAFRDGDLATDTTLRAVVGRSEHLGARAALVVMEAHPWTRLSTIRDAREALGALDERSLEVFQVLCGAEEGAERGPWRARLTDTQLRELCALAAAVIRVHS